MGSGASSQSCWLWLRPFSGLCSFASSCWGRRSYIAIHQRIRPGLRVQQKRGRRKGPGSLLVIMPYLLSGFFCDRVIRERDRKNGEGTVSQPLKFEGQDYVVLKQRCLAQKCLFEDRVFPAGVQALGSHELSQKAKMKAITWKRPKVGIKRARNLQRAVGKWSEVASGQNLRPWIYPNSEQVGH